MSDTLSKLGDALAKNWLSFIPLGLLALAGLLRFAHKSVAQRRLSLADYSSKDIADVYLGLRNEALHWKPADIGMSPTDGAYGVVMDWGRASGVVTVTSFNSGDASLYVSTGGGILGGVGHEAVREAARAFVAEAAKRLPWMIAASEFPLPKIGWAYFYVLTGRGVFLTLVRVAPIERNYGPLWSAAQLVVAVVRGSMPDATKRMELADEAWPKAVTGPTGLTRD